MRVKKESEKAVLKLNIQKTKIMVSSSITSCQINGEKLKAVTDLFSWAPKSLDGDCSHEIKRCLLLGMKTMTNVDSLLENRDITLPTKLLFSQWSCTDVRVGPQRRLDTKELTV